MRPLGPAPRGVSSLGEWARGGGVRERGGRARVAIRARRVERAHAARGIAVARVSAVRVCVRACECHVVVLLR